MTSTVRLRRIAGRSGRCALERARHRSAGGRRLVGAFTPDRPGISLGAYLLAAVVAVALFVARCWPTRGGRHHAVATRGDRPAAR